MDIGRLVLLLLLSFVTFPYPFVLKAYQAELTHFRLLNAMMYASILGLYLAGKQNYQLLLPIYYGLSLLVWVLATLQPLIAGTDACASPLSTGIPEAVSWLISAFIIYQAQHDIWVITQEKIYVKVGFVVVTLLKSVMYGIKYSTPLEGFPRAFDLLAKADSVKKQNQKALDQVIVNNHMYIKNHQIAVPPIIHEDEVMPSMTSEDVSVLADLVKSGMSKYRTRRPTLRSEFSESIPVSPASTNPSDKKSSKSTLPESTSRVDVGLIKSTSAFKVENMSTGFDPSPIAEMGRGIRKGSNIQQPKSNSPSTRPSRTNDSPSAEDIGSNFFVSVFLSNAPQDLPRRLNSKDIPLQGEEEVQDTSLNWIEAEYKVATTDDGSQELKPISNKNVRRPSKVAMEPMLSGIMEVNPKSQPAPKDIHEDKILE
ncbi:hypothetical protein EDD86DRAFT_249887 [Gorgonomyces haynaldii]|nr:hypothetical protein EDD86DRAFT_249887 [Gorgonomyces haynaldii]